jgi:hypothetical protein
MRENCCGKFFRTGTLINIILFLIFIAAFFMAKGQIDSILKDTDVIILISVFFILLIIISILTICKSYFPSNKAFMFPLILFLSANMLLVINKASPYYQDEKKPSTKYLAQTIKYNRKDGDIIFCYGYYYQDFPVYLDSLVGVVGGLGELCVCKDIHSADDRLLSEDQFWNLFKTSSKRIFVLLTRDDYRKKFANIIKITEHKILDFDKYFIVITNR